MTEQQATVERKLGNFEIRVEDGRSFSVQATDYAAACWLAMLYAEWRPDAPTGTAISPDNAFTGIFASMKRQVFENGLAAHAGTKH